MPTDVGLLVSIASLYYERNQTQQQIADQMGMSRFKVLALLKEARELGIVHISISNPLSGCQELEDDLKKAFGLKIVRVVPGITDSDIALKVNLGRAAATLLNELLEDGFILGISWGTTITHMIDALEFLTPNRKKITVCPLLGGLDQVEPYYQINDQCKRVAEAFGGTYRPLYAPWLVGSPGIRDLLMKDPSINQVTSLWSKMNIALVGIGTLLESFPPSFKESLSAEEIKLLELEKAVGNICCYFYKSDGSHCCKEIDSKLIGMSFDQLRKVQYQIAIAGGNFKLKAIYSALQGKIVNGLVTDEQTTRKLLEF